MPSERVALPGSERVPLSNARRIAAVDPQETVTATVVLRRRTSSRAAAEIQALSGQAPRERRYRSREEFAALHGADPSELGQV